MAVLILLAVATAIFVAVVLLGRRGEPSRSAAVVRGTGFGVTLATGAFLALVFVGEAVVDPGGWAAAGLIASWMVPLAALLLLAWYLPDLAGTVFVVLVSATLVLSVWFALDPGGWGAFEDRNGPVRAVGLLLLVGGLALFGLRRTRQAGLLLLFVGLVPLAIASLGHGGLVSLALPSIPATVTGTLYLASAALDSGEAPGATSRRRGPGSAEPPKAA